MTRIIEILQHDIEYSYKDDQEMSDPEEEHVYHMIIDGYSEGDLDDNEGWWKIKRR
jgi:hypothetical protein